MARKKKGHAHEEHASEAWLIPYADILTLLLALFIVLFAGSQADQAKMAAMADAFNAAFNTGGPSFFDNKGPSASQTSTLPIDDANQAYIRENQQLTEVQQKMEEYIEKSGLTDELSTVLTEEGLAIRIKENVLFPSGSATLLDDSKKLAKPISELLGKINQRIIISGHTDNVPISNNAFPSNWDLSAQRSLNFMKFLLAQSSLEPARFSTVGYGEYQPVAKNDSDAGRAQNRRVEILISRANHSTQMKTIQ